MERAARITRPCLVLRGRESDLVSLDGVREVLTAIPHAKFVDIGGAHHMIVGDRNDAFAGELLLFLKQTFGSNASHGSGGSGGSGSGGGDEGSRDLVGSLAEEEDEEEVELLYRAFK